MLVEGEGSPQNDFFWGVASKTRWGCDTPTRGSAPRPWMLLNWIPLADWFSGLYFWIRLPDQFIINVEYKIDHISETTNRAKNSQTQISVSEHCVSCETAFFITFLVDKSTWRLWTKSTITLEIKIGNNNFLFLSVHCASVMKIEPFLRGKGGGMGSASLYLGQDNCDANEGDRYFPRRFFPRGFFPARFFPR